MVRELVSSCRNITAPTPCPHVFLVNLFKLVFYNIVTLIGKYYLKVAGLDLNGGKANNSSPITTKSSSNSGVYIPPHLREGGNSAPNANSDNREEGAPSTKYEGREQRGGGGGEYRRGGGGRGYNNSGGGYGGRRGGNRYEDNNSGVDGKLAI